MGVARIKILRRVGAPSPSRKTVLEKLPGHDRLRRSAPPPRKRRLNSPGAALGLTDHRPSPATRRWRRRVEFHWALNPRATRRDIPLDFAGHARLGSGRSSGPEAAPPPVRRPWPLLRPYPGLRSFATSPLPCPPSPSLSTLPTGGESHDAPKNTVTSAKLALEQRADALATAIWLTKGGQMTVSHDLNAKRTTGRNAKLWEQLAR